jgi:ATP-dependent Clp protease ATP-binding subunit ClpC
MKVFNGKEKLGNYYQSTVDVDFNYLLRFKGSRKSMVTLDSAMGSFFLGIGLAIILISILILFLGGRLNLNILLNPKSFIEFLPYLSIPAFVFAFYLRRDREVFDTDLQPSKLFKILSESKNGNPRVIKYEKFLLNSVLCTLDYNFFKRSSGFLLGFTFDIFNSPKISKVIERRLGVNMTTINQILPKHINQNNVLFENCYRELFLNSLIQAHELESDVIDEFVLFFTLSKYYFQQLFRELNINDIEIESVKLWYKNEIKKKNYYQKWEILSKIKPTGSINKAFTTKATPILNQNGDDLTAKAATGAFNLSIGRENEMLQMFQSLERDSSGSAILLIGDPGVGKSRFIKYLATRMVVEDVPSKLQDSRLVSIDLGKTLTKAGTVDQFKQLLQQMFEETKSSGNLILVLEDFAQILTMRDDSKLEVVNLILNNINQSKLKLIATCHTDDYAKYIRPIKSLAALFDVLKFNEPPANLSLQVLIDEIPVLEKKYKLNIQVSSVKRITEFAPRFNYERVMPDKGLDLLEESCIRAKNKGLKHVDASVVDEILKDKVGIDVGTISESESKKLQNLENYLHERVVGQDEAIKSISLAIRRARSGLSVGNKPVASFLFFGPTGVGKTELAKTLAEAYYGDEKLLVRIDMSEYQEESNLNRLIGYTDDKGNFIGGYLTESVRSRPYSLILLDEVEKANKKVLDLFLQVLDEGFLTDGMGRKINFSNTIIIMTSNAASKEIADLIMRGEKYEEVYKYASQKLREQFRIEFLNRFDKVIMFRPLNLIEIQSIVKIVLEKIRENLSYKGMLISWNNLTLQKLAELGYNPVYGARELKRIVQENVEDKLASLIIDGRLKSGGDVVFDGLEIDRVK